MDAKLTLDHLIANINNRLLQQSGFLFKMRYDFRGKILFATTLLICVRCLNTAFWDVEKERNRNCRTEIVFCSRVDLRGGFMILVAAKLLVISRSVSTIKFVLNGLNFLSLTFKWYSRRKYSVNF